MLIKESWLVCFLPLCFIMVGIGMNNNIYCHAEQVTPPVIAAPPAGCEADYAWYETQFKDHGKFTPIGPAGDPADVAVSANGQIYSVANVGGYHTGLGIQPLPEISPTLMPHALAFALYEDGKVIPMGLGEPLRQSLTEGCLRIVKSFWKYDTLQLHQTSFGQPLRGDEIITGHERTLAWAGLDIINNAQEDKDVILLVFITGDEENPRPEFRFLDGVLFSGDDAVVSATAPEGFTLEYAPVFPANASIDKDDPWALIRNRQGVFNALVMRGSIPSGQTVRVIVNRAFKPADTVFYKVDAEGPAVSAKELTGKSYEQQLQSVKNQLGCSAEKISPFETPDEILNNLYTKAMLDGYFLTRRWDSCYVVFDSVIYRCQWDDSSAKWIYALNLMGDHETAGKLLDTIFARQGKNKPTGTRTYEGCFSDYTNTIGESHKLASWTSGPGWALWTMAEHARMYNDRTWLDKHKQQILDGCAWIIRERNFSKEKPDNPCAGLIWGRFVCDLKSGTDGYFTYSDAICHLGLHSIAQLLTDWGYAEGPKLLQEAEAYRQDILAVVDKFTDKSSDPWYVPWILHRPELRNRYFHDTCGPIYMVTGDVVPIDDERVGHILRWIIDKEHHGSLEHLVSGNNSLGNMMSGTCFYSQDLAVALLQREQVEEYLRILYSLSAAAISHQTLTTTEWGDNTQPHIHSISSLIRIFRTMLVDDERPGRLSLLQGTPRRWFDHGQKICIRQAPTAYGPVSLSSESHLADGFINMNLTVPDRIGDTPIYLKVRLPIGYQINNVTINGKKHPDVQGEWIVLRQKQGCLNMKITVDD